MWHQVGLLFFNYHNDARSNKHKIKKMHYFINLVKSSKFTLKYTVQLFDDGH